jgi:hypothetical protein
LLNLKKFPITVIMLCLLAFMLPALPGIAKTIIHVGSGGQGELWLEGVRWVAGYTCNPSTWTRRQLLHAGLFLLLACASLCAFPKYTVRRTVMILWSAVALMCLAGTIFADGIPIPFIIKLSLWRSTVIYLFLAIIFIAWACLHIARHSRTHALLAATLILLLTGYLPKLPQSYCALLLPVVIYSLFAEQTATASKRGVILAGTSLALLYLAAIILLPNTACLALFISSALIIIIINAPTYLPRAKMLLPWALGLLIFDAAVLTAQGGPKIYYHGRLQGELDPWADVQFVARDISDRDDLFIVPPLRNDFYHYSLRAVLGDWAEGSTLLYLDNRFTEEWFERMQALGWTKPYNAEAGFNSLTTADITRAARMYGASFVVTEKPKEFDLPKAYENSRFILFRFDATNSDNQ